jgi:hypothetical protein
MGIYSSYLDQNLSPDDVVRLRKEQLARISSIRGREIFVYASDFVSPIKAQRGAPVALDSSDILPVSDQLDNLTGDSIDVILETPGGNGTVAEDIVHILREKFKSVSFIVPGQAKSAGTIMVMSGDEILMDYRSAVGPIDAQITFEGKQFSAEALLKGIEQILKISEEKGSLNRGYIPILQRLSPGDIQNAQNALDFARFLVRDWLCAYKFKNWTTHRTHDIGAVVTDEQKRAQAQSIADALCDHSKWLSHGKSIRLKDLRTLGLEVTDFATQTELADAIARYQALLRLTFDLSPIYKILETPTSQINRTINMTQPGLIPFLQAAQGQPAGQVLRLTPGNQAGMLIDVNCQKCGKHVKIQADLDSQKPLQPGCIRFPDDDNLACTKCHQIMQLGPLRANLEKQTGRKVAKK